MVLALTVPVSANVVLTSAVGTGADANLVTISYNCTGVPAEKVRAFALDVNAGGKLVVGSAAPIPVGGVIHYYVYPGSIQFAVTGGGETYISDLGTPMANQTVAGGVVEMASLYAASDPNHTSAPPSSGGLVKFRINCPPGPVTVKITLNTQRGGVVLEDPNVIPTVTLPADLVVCPSGTPPCWSCPGQPLGDTNGSGTINATDYFNFKKSYGTGSATHPHGTGAGQYNCCCDFNKDLKVNATDYFTFKKNYGKTGLGTCADISCP